MTDMLLFEENKEVILNKIKVSPEMEEKVFFHTLILVSRYGAYHILPYIVWNVFITLTPILA